MDYSEIEAPVMQDTEVQVDFDLGTDGYPVETKVYNADGQEMKPGRTIEFSLISVETIPGCCVTDSDTETFRVLGGDGRDLAKCYRENGRAVEVSGLSAIGEPVPNSIAVVLGQRVTLEELTALHDVVAWIIAEAE